MSSTRGETANQRAARFRTAERRRCPACDRKSALGAKVEILDTFDGEHMGHVRRCLYCKHEVGIVLGKTFGRSSSDAPTLDEAQALAEGGFPR